MQNLELAKIQDPCLVFCKIFQEKNSSKRKFNFDLVQFILENLRPHLRDEKQIKF